MKLHHTGIAVKDVNKSISSYEALGWKLEGEVIEDVARNVYLAFLRSEDGSGLIELVSPMGEESPVTGTLKKMNKTATPYHLCYEVSDLEKTVEDLQNQGFYMVHEAEPAIAFGGRRVVFMMNKNVGLFEILEEE